MSGETQLQGPDLSQGVPLAELPEGGQLLGHSGGEPVLVVRRGEEIFAVGATCTHYGGPLAEGLVVDETIRCPWHHACFSLRTGEAVRAPALNPVARWTVERRGERVHVAGRAPPPAGGPPRNTTYIGAGPHASPNHRAPHRADAPSAIVIVGAGAAGHAAAE